MSGDTMLPEYELTDLGNAERLVDQHGGDLLYCAGRDDWFTWTGPRYEVDRDGEVVRRATNTLRTIKHAASEMKDRGRADLLWAHAQRSENVGRIKAMIELASTQKKVCVSPAGLDADPWLFNCANCTIETRTGTPRKHRREDLITKLSPSTTHRRRPRRRGMRSCAALWAATPT